MAAGAAISLVNKQRHVWSIVGLAAAGTTVALVAHAATCLQTTDSEKAAKERVDLKSKMKRAIDSENRM
jgi:hypothetical protein